MQRASFAPPAGKPSGGSFLFVPENDEQRRAAEAIQRHDIVFLLGPAGTGKTHLAVGAALGQVAGRPKDKKDKLVLVRPMVEAGERVGFLPGDVAQKVDPWLQPVYDVLTSMMFQPNGAPMAHQAIKDFLEEHVEYAPLAYMRGRSFARKVVILDEAQNATRRQLQMFLSRIGKGGKLILTGDPGQSDLEDDDDANALADAADALEGLAVKDREGRRYSVGVVDLVRSVRHPLIGAMLRRLEARGFDE